MSKVCICKGHRLTGAPGFLKSILLFVQSNQSGSVKVNRGWWASVRPNILGEWGQQWMERLPHGTELSQQAINPTDSSRELHLLWDWQELLHQPQAWGEGCVGWKRPDVSKLKNKVNSLILSLCTTLKNLSLPSPVSYGINSVFSKVNISHCYYLLLSQWLRIKFEAPLSKYQWIFPP